MDFDGITGLSLHSQIILGCLLVFLFSTLITWLTCIYAVRKKIIAIPNERSSHQIPTPQGGGIAIVLTFIVAVLWLGLYGLIEPHLVWALAGSVAIAVIGYCDDMYNVKIRWRIVIHFFMACWAVYWLHGFSILDLGSHKVNLNWMGSVLAVFGITWCINLYNFMDGIDGLAGSEALFAAVASGLALWIIGDLNTAFMLWLLAAAVAGFTLWNWPPAKIFLGDVGSCFLGYVLAVFAIHSANKSLLPIAFWFILLAVFICDSTFTLFLRILQRKRWYSAHREHAYQHLVQYGISHKQITTSIFILNILLLLPLAFAVLFWPLKTLWFLLGTIICLFLLWSTIKSLRIS